MAEMYQMQKVFVSNKGGDYGEKLEFTGGDGRGSMWASPFRRNLRRPLYVSGRRESSCPGVVAAFAVADSALAAGVVVSLCCAAQAQPVDAAGHQWWQHAVFYEIYPRSFADSNNDGVGDLNGITSKMRYLHDLGVDAIWITPCYPSPQVDFGYDVADYRNIDPMYGTLSDFEAWSPKAGNITCASSWISCRITPPTSTRGFSIRSLPVPRPIVTGISGVTAKTGQPPNNWISIFGGSAWKFDPTTNQYYYHFFYAQQPDLNWRNPAVEKVMLDTTSWWYKRGVSGFRLDAVDTLFEDPELHDNPLLPGTNAQGDPRRRTSTTRICPRSTRS